MKGDQLKFKSYIFPKSRVLYNMGVCLCCINFSTIDSLSFEWFHCRFPYFHSCWFQISILHFHGHWSFQIHLVKFSHFLKEGCLCTFQNIMGNIFTAFLWIAAKHWRKYWQKQKQASFVHFQHFSLHYVTFCTEYRRHDSAYTSCRASF